MTTHTDYVVCPACHGSPIVDLPTAPVQPERIATTAGVPPRYRGYTLANFPATFGTREAVDACARYAVSRPKSALLLLGDAGVGKTSLAIATATRMAETGVTECFVFWSVPELLDQIRRSYSRIDGGNAGVVDQALSVSLMQADLLVMDDIGAERQTEWVLERLFVVLNARMNWELPTLFTSNLTATQLAERLGDRIASRLIADATVVTMTGADLRGQRGARS